MSNDEDPDIDLSDPIVTEPGESLVESVATARSCSCPSGWPRRLQAEQELSHHRDCATNYALDPDIDEAKMERVADEVVALAARSGVNRKEMASMCLAIAVNHMFATGVLEERAGLAAVGMYRWRRRIGMSEATRARVLVPEPAAKATRPPGTE